MAPEKLLAEWFWIDRWVGSSAFGLNLEARGLYREMLTQAWRRGAQLPNDHDQIRRVVGVTKAEWRRAWRFVERFWRVDGDRLVNDTQLQIYAETQSRQQRASKRGLAGAHARHTHRLSTAQAVREHQPLSLSPVSYHQSPKEEDKARALVGHRKHAYCGTKFCVPAFLHEQFANQLGERGLARFDLLTWYPQLDARYEDFAIPGDVLAWVRKEFTEATKGLFADPRQARAVAMGVR